VRTDLEGQRVRGEVQAAIDRLLAGKACVRVLEAGCGSMSHVRFPEASHLTGVDISQRQLDGHRRLDERIVGDVQTCELPAESFDAVVCWNVLEHLRDPEAAVRRLAAAVRPGGILVLACPNPMSFQGLGARLTPQWFHVWFYRTVLGVKEAGTEGVAPFPTVMSSRIAPGALCKLGESCGLAVELRILSEGSWWWGRNSGSQRVLERVLEGLAAVLRVLTIGKYRGELAETRLVLRKNSTTL
jgi:hypothetical protein